MKAISGCLIFLSFTFIGLVPEGYARNHSEQQVSPEAQREGRWAIVTNATLYGFFLYGPGTARLLELESARQIVGLEMLMGGGSFFLHLRPRRIIGSVPDVPITHRGQFSRYPIWAWSARVI